MKKLLFLALTLVSVLAFATVANADTTEVVTAADVDSGGEWYSADTRPPGTGTFETGPATPPLGTGSFEASTPDAIAKVQLFTTRYDNVALADIDGIGYSTYREPTSLPPSGPARAALNLRIDTDNDGQADSYMVYEPYVDPGAGAFADGVWQNWDAYRGGTAKWWINSGAAGCGQGTPCTWSFIVANLPNPTIQEAPSCGNLTFPKPVCPGSAGINQGSNNPNTVSNADAFYVSRSGDKTTFDFEEALPLPTTSEECKKGGWMNYGTTFKNQGDCEAFVKTGGKNEPGQNVR